MNPRRVRQTKGIIGMSLAVLGGVAWFYQFYIGAFTLWGTAVGIMLSLNRRRQG
ncbi:MAG TPA: hypothetical protein VNI77_07700 [Nitrososphaera sp.]|nr:hypothetical protein [Nitrososphaera sp.]